jgi:integrase
MPRALEGTLVDPGADGLWRGRVTKTADDGTKTRPLFSLGTSDKSLARRKLARVVAELAAGRNPFEAADLAGAPERVSDYAEAWIARRTTQGVGMAQKEKRNLELYVLDAIGRLPLSDVRPLHVRSILDEAAAKGLKHKTVADIRGVLHRLFRAALEDELTETNPVAAVRTPKGREVRKERAILTDDEFSRFVACAAVDLELRMLSLVARCEGGMRTNDLHVWDWTMIDRVAFAECIIPRAKTRTPQRLSIPDVLSPFVRAWWERAGKPESGPVFPVTRGKRAGEVKSPSNSYAKRLRRDLFRAGVYRAAPVEVPSPKPGQRTDLGKATEGTKLAPNPRDPLYFETATTLPVDFHSFRRAFASALAEAGVNVQHAMHLTSHSDPRVHARYVMHTAAMRAIPDAALPALTAGAMASEPRAKPPEANRIVTGCDDSASKGGGEVLGASPNSATSAPIPGSDCWTRTSDPAVNSRLLYQLS